MTAVGQELRQEKSSGVFEPRGKEMVVLATESRMDSKIWLTALAKRLVKSASDKKLSWLDIPP